MINSHWLPVVWGFIIAFVIFAYVTLDGFDLGVGVLFAAERERAERDVMVDSIAPVWDGNETWLVLGGSFLYGAFPVAYSVILPAVYPVIITMLMALILRGVSFEFRFRAATERGRWNWDVGLMSGSIIAGFCQGVILGAVLHGIPVSNMQFAGGALRWFSYFSIFTGFAVVLAYAFLGSTWLIWRTDGRLQARMRKIAAKLAVAMLGLVLVFSCWTPMLHHGFAQRWFSGTGVLATALASLVLIFLFYCLFHGLRKIAVTKRDWAPFAFAIAIFLVNFAGVGYSLYPNIVPPNLTLWRAASPVSSQLFLLIGAGVMIPVIVGYNIFAYYVFRGKIDASTYYH